MCTQGTCGQLQEISMWSSTWKNNQKETTCHFSLSSQNSQYPRIFRVREPIKRGENCYPLIWIVPADNSCLFSSVSYVMLGDTSYASELRNLIAKSVSGDPQTYNPVFLGGSNSDYCNWILDKEHWGGAIELSILSKYYQAEIAVVDTESGRVDRFGEGSGYSNCVYLVYDGIHYDPLAVHSLSDPSNPLQTVFPVGDDTRLTEALEIAAAAKKRRQFTNLSQFSVRCLVCNTLLSGQQATQAHAVSTGHTNFGEV
ncbi:ubiquitin thioesterase OTU1-like isoform X3 [Acropora palmata]|uniref:ubiquitin thioesterase OTU1-like isoform X3 n=1 Tax=Acropora palmata TaxID=6131 RepID=UPI003DA0BED2